MQPFKKRREIVSTGGTIFIINGGSSAETPEISKPMKITAQDGTAIVGHIP